MHSKDALLAAGVLEPLQALLADARCPPAARVHAATALGSLAHGAPNRAHCVATASIVSALLDEMSTVAQDGEAGLSPPPTVEAACACLRTLGEAGAPLAALGGRGVRGFAAAVLPLLRAAGPVAADAAALLGVLGATPADCERLEACGALASLVSALAAVDLGNANPSRVTQHSQHSPYSPQSQESPQAAGKTEHSRTAVGPLAAEHHQQLPSPAGLSALHAYLQTLAPLARHSRNAAALLHRCHLSNGHRASTWLLASHPRFRPTLQLLALDWCDGGRVVL